MEQVAGIEPALNAWEALVLPLNYTCKLTTYYCIINKNNYNLLITRKSTNKQNLYINTTKISV